MENLEQNKSIAEFLGMIYVSGSKCFRHKTSTGTKVYRETELTFDKSLDAINPALMKIESMGYVIVQKSTHNSYNCVIKSILGELFSATYESRILALNHAVCEFIKWQKLTEHE